MKHKSILIVGRRPPPIGGVTIHVDRLCKWLEEKRISFSFVNYRQADVFTLLHEVYRHSIVHINSTNPFLIFFVVIFSKATRTLSVVTFHGNLSFYNGLRSIVLRMALKSANVPLLLNRESYSAVKVINKNARLISAYIPPLKEEHLDQRIVDEIARRSSGKSLICATNAFDLTFDYDCREIYGITDIINTLKDKNWLLVVSDPSGNYKKFVQSKYPEALNEKVLFISENHSFSALLSMVDVFIRNTTTDGDSLSIHEALHLGKMVWASDCVTRPVGVRTYRKLEEVLSDQSVPLGYSPPQVVDEIVRLYNDLLSRLRQS